VAISASNLTSGGSGTDATSYTTASITPASNALILCTVENDVSGVPAVPTVSGCSLTWVQIETCYYDQSGTRFRVTMFRALGASPTSGTLTIDMGGATQGGCGWIVDQFTNTDTTGTNGSGAIVQSAKSAEPDAAAGTNVTATLGSGITSGNAAYTVAAWEANESGTAESGWTGIGASGHTGPSTASKSSWRNDNVDNSGTTSWATSALAGAIIVEIKAGAAVTYGLASRDWRWYTNSNATVQSGDALAAVSTTPTLDGAQMANVRLRLRLQLKEVNTVAGTTAALKLQYSQDSSNWVTLEPTATPFTPETAVANNEGVWIRYGDGLGTIGNTITTVLTNSTVAGKYHEDQQATEPVTSAAIHELDWTIYVHHPPPDITLKFRVMDGASGIGPDTTYAYPSITTSTAANRGNTVVYMDPDTSTKVGRELRFGSWNRVFYEPAGGNWWLFTCQFATGTVVRSYRWDGSAASWTAGATYTASDSLTATRHAFAMKTISGTPVVWSHTGTSTTLRYYNRGTISGTTLTWGTEANVSQASSRHNHICIDDGNFIWLVGIQSGGGGLYARRSTNADTGSSWTTGWQSASTLTDANALTGNVVTAVPLASNKILVVWYSGTPLTSGTLKWATVVDGTGWSSANNIDASTDNHAEDWGIVRNGNFVFLACTDSATGAPGGAAILRIYDIASPPSTTWTLGTSPGVSGTPSNDDGIPLTATASGELWAYWTINGPESGQDRAAQYKRYRYTPGAESSGSWSSAVTLTPNVARGNADTMSVPATSGGNQAVLLWLFGDDSQGAANNLATGFAAEFFAARVAALPLFPARMPLALLAR
jgi:hypothetical protein